VAQIIQLRRRLPSSAVSCLRKLTDHAEAGEITGVAFVCLIDGGKYIADTCGDASGQHTVVRDLLKALDAKIAKRQLTGRR
jgi:hypothetical protein